MEPPVHEGEIMFAPKNILPVLVLGIVACSEAESRQPFPLSNDTSVKVPPFSDTTAAEPEPVADDTVAVKSDRTAPKKHEPAEENAPPECPKEAEPNNDPEQASEFTRCITGELTSWTDNDYIKIVAPKNVTDMIVDHVETGGNISYSVSTPQGGGAGGSSSFNMSFTDQAPKTKITPGQTYLFSLKWDNNGQGKVSDKRPYMVRVTFE